MFLALQLLIFLVWEVGGKDMFGRMIAVNPDELDKVFYARVIEGMRFAMLFVAGMTILSAVLGRGLRWIRSLVERRPLLLMLCLSIVLQCVLILLLRTPPHSDAVMYVEHAQRLVEFGSYITASGDPTAFWPVGFPALLAGVEIVTGDMLFWSRFLTVLANAVTIWASWKLFSPVLSEKGRMVFAGIFALQPAMLFSAVPLLTDHIFLALLVTAMMLFVRNQSYWSTALSVGVLLGLGSYIRPVGMLFAAGFAVAFILRDAKVYRAALMIAVLALLLSPWIARNYNVFGSFVVLSTNGGYNFLMGNHAESTGGVNFDFDYNPDGLDEAGASVDAYRRGLHDIADHPSGALLRIWKKLFHAFRRGDAMMIWAVKPIQERFPSRVLASVFYLTNLVMYAILLASVLSLLLGRAYIPYSPLSVIVVVTAIVTLLSVLVFYGSDRYLIPLLPLYAFLCARMMDSRHTARNPGSSISSHRA